MYYIYHIPSIKKVGCTTSLVRRVELSQGFSNLEYEVLFKTQSIKEASDLELLYQKKYRYKVDKNNYLTLKQKKMIQHISNQTVTFKVKPSEIKEEMFKNLKIELPNLGTIVMDSDEICKWACSNIHKSFMQEGSYFIYNKALYNAYKTISFGNTENTVFDNIREWALERDLYSRGNSSTQYIKLMEEAGELAQALLKRDEPEIYDAIGDIVIVLTNLAEMEGVKIEDCINDAYNEIKNRKGSMKNGTFVKNN